MNETPTPRTDEFFSIINARQNAGTLSQWELFGEAKKCCATLERDLATAIHACAEMRDAIEAKLPGDCDIIDYMQTQFPLRIKNIPLSQYIHRLQSAARRSDAGSDYIHKDALKAVQDDNDKLREMLKSLEWCGAGEFCPVCIACKDDGHHMPQCQLAALLEAE